MEAMESNDNDTLQDQDLCRLCDCESDENGEMFSIFDKNEEGQEIIDLIQECLPLIVYKTDPLSKSICADCLENLDSLNKFKKRSLAVANKHKEKLRTNGEIDNEKIQVFLSYQKVDSKVNNGDSDNSEGTERFEEKSAEVETQALEIETPSREVETESGELETGEIESPTDEVDMPTEKVEVQTSTEDITIFCNNCRSEILEAHKVNKEIELCSELHQAIADSFAKNRIVTSDKILRSRRKRSHAFYQELDDSLCSSLTEFTNTESSQCFDFQSDIDSLGDDEDERPSKRKRMETPKERVVIEPVCFEKKFGDEYEYRYNPFSLLQLCLNVINKENIPEYEPDDFTELLVEPECSYCAKKYKNSKLLALHEITHMSIELGEKVDNPTLWHESRDDSYVRNKWLTSEDDFAEEENEAENETLENDAMEMEPEEEESLLIHVGSAEQRDGQNYEVTREVSLMDGKPYVDGLPLSDYPKEERRAFYHSMRIGGVNKRFCALCRYSFKDNWAIESHYFSMACHYTCRYCGMRFNKQRNRFDEHVEIHIKNKDEYSKKVFAASKNNNIVPKVLYPKKRYSSREHVEIMIPQPIEVKNYVPLQRKSLQPEVKIKQERMVYSPQPSQMQQNSNQQLQTSQSKTGNQAYFCRKCYKVFFKLDEFNVHSKNCDYNQFPNNTMLGSYLSSGSKHPNGEPAAVSGTGRPVRNCAKEAGPYRDEVYIPEHILREQVHTSASQGPFICYICNTPFPTIYSRNSHMRIHKAENMTNTPPSTSQSPQLKPRPSYQEQNPYQTHFAQVKEEPMDFEPEVEIHEPVAQENYSSGLSPAVSITPISKNPHLKPQINPNVMKLVQNNPQLSIKNREPQQQSHNQQMQQQLQQMLSGQGDPDRSYKCSSCWEAFANKSHLYFHKKNQCEGSKYPCPFCKKRFGTEAAYSSHIFYSHPE
ncbi:hypothetical protein HHI36_019382 [Cryptolaemus montrouzieri]|uniref:Uncharacterized protein n=1 Tax=Cryptolaemus montrouzieri TaxID=559131 RepID=A0ABD2P3M6_9CUCU